MLFEIVRDDLADGKMVAVLNDHLQEMHKYSPAESVHALTPDSLRDPAVTFWSARLEGEVLGWGVLKALSATTGEVKSMKTSPEYLRGGVGASILGEIIGEAKRRGYVSLSLETGTHVAFDAAVHLYTKYGFTECGPFGDYQPDPHSRFYRLNIRSLKAEPKA